MGPNRLHGPHHSAQKSTKTMSLSVMVSSKLSAEISIVAMPMLLVTNGLLIGAFAAATVSTAGDSHLFHTRLRASEIARRRAEEERAEEFFRPRATTTAPDSEARCTSGRKRHYLIATSRRIGIATSTASCRFRRSSRYSIALSTRDQRVFGRYSADIISSASARDRMLKRYRSRASSTVRIPY